MKRAIHIFGGVVIGCLFLCGCGDFLTAFLCFGVELPTDLTAIPPELQFVIDHQDDFESTDHPLQSVTAGTVIDDLESSLDGCWGYVGTETQHDGLASKETLVIAVSRFDIDRGLLQVQELAGLEGNIDLWDGLPALFVLDREITAISDSQVELSELFQDGALIRDDGTLRGDCLTGVSATLSEALPISATIDGDAMVTFEDFEFSNQRREWIRFDCPTSELALLPLSEPDGE